MHLFDDIVFLIDNLIAEGDVIHTNKFTQKKDEDNSINPSNKEKSPVFSIELERLVRKLNEKLPNFHGVIRSNQKIIGTAEDTKEMNELMNKILIEQARLKKLNSDNPKDEGIK